MLKVILTKGLPASGKSTWAKDIINKEPSKWKRINKDDLRLMLDNSRWSKANEKFVLDTRDFLITTALIHGFNVIVDDTNLHPKHEINIKNLVKLISGKDEKLGISSPIDIQMEIKDFTDVSPKTCIERDLKRSNSVGSKVIMQMYNQFIKPKEEPIEWDYKLPECIICDLDGTLALFEGNPYERDFTKDKLNIPVSDIIHKYARSGTKIFFVSGRKDKFRKQTEEWLTTKGVDYSLPLMREGEDERKDSIVKKEIYDNFIKGKYNVLFVLDDRDQMVEMWRSFGITCLQVNYGDF